MNHLRHNIILVISVGLCVAGLVAYAIFFFTFEKNINATKHDREQILLLNAQEQDIRLQKKLIENSEAKRETLTHYFLSEKDLVPFLETVESLGAGAGTSTKIVSVDVTKPSEGGQAFPTLTISLESTGSYRGVFDLLALLEQLPYEIGFTKTDFSRTTTEDAAPLWQLTTTFTVISFIPNTV